MNLTELIAEAEEVIPTEEATIHYRGNHWKDHPLHWWWRCYASVAWYDYHKPHVTFHFERWFIRRRTPQGIYLYHHVMNPPKWDKFVLVGAKKRYAAPTKQEAWESLVARNSRQVGFAKAAYKKAQIIQHSLGTFEGIPT